ncbi:4-hydroxy-tetrahydrodipicolinate reductase [Ferruginibacter albus]|uniref:4-hydroxy-tetrahydrodipicolinate reductase n=1 Tax=Ferruginibacter albus TaxID=2875540 RepID=UPI001CC50A57|nr:4-hydroxy-tetrahydrodipicolinate reductase [Ferruginibacter albus]UAY52811.1 4-hydroxy-tetrahydrodipicolinate reductase [Ferruginibacter albus]
MKIALIGYGKMGKAIEEIALQKGHEVVLKIDVTNADELTPKNLQQADVAIEFTGPHTAVQNIFTCFEAGIPLVCGSTGWLEKLDDVKRKAVEKNAGFLYASNFSIGVNIFFEVNKKLAQLMSRQDSYEIKTTEIHHTEKKDAPSGTSITLAEQILENIPRKKHWVNRESVESDDLTIISKRIDPAPGTHIIKYFSDIDEIEIIHTAHNRKGFAAGAVQAAEFMNGKTGLYSMKDVLGL